MAALKKRRLHVGPPIENKPKENGINDFTKLPLEMLAEILSYTSSPDILSLVRTSRFFFDVLVVNPWSLVIWKKARQRFQPLPIPDPLPTFTETSCVAFLFDTAHCQSCGKMTKWPLFSYALRARLCGKQKCAKKWISVKEIPKIGTMRATSPTGLAYARAIQTWMPYHELATAYLYRLDDWDAAIQKHKDAILDFDQYKQLQQEYAKKAERLPIITEYNNKISTWSTKTRAWQAEVTTENKKLLEDKAIGNSWELQDFYETQLYKTLMETHDNNGEKLREEDYVRFQDEFKEQVAQCRKDRIRALTDKTARLNRADLRSYWNSLRTAKKGPVPVYSQFRRLNMVRILEQKNTDEVTLLKGSNETVRQELRNNVYTRDHLTREINAWLNEKRAKLSDKLGHVHPELAVAGGYQHPAERINAWYICTKCKKEMDPMDFQRVCGHECKGLTDKEKSNGAWDVNWFEVDAKAIAAANELLRVSTLDDKLITTKNSLMEFGARFLCRSCQSPIVMDALSVIRHARRHNTITLELLTSEDANKILKKPFEPGLAAKCMAHSKGAWKERQQADYICRHCQEVKKRFNFNGLRSHLKTKHNVTAIKDEDFR